MKKFLNNPWTIGLGTAFFSFVLTIIWDKIKGIEILSTLKFLFTYAFNALIAILNFRVKVWWLLIGIAILSLGLFFAVKVSEANGENQPSFLKYTHDEIQGWVWEWEWVKIYGKYEIRNLHPICPWCGTPLVSGLQYGGAPQCLRCDEYFIKSLPSVDHVQVIIYDNVKRNLFPKEVETDET